MAALPPTLQGAPGAQQPHHSHPVGQEKRTIPSPLLRAAGACPAPRAGAQRWGCFSRPLWTPEKAARPPSGLQGHEHPRPRGAKLRLQGPEPGGTPLGRSAPCSRCRTRGSEEGLAPRTPRGQRPAWTAAPVAAARSRAAEGRCTPVGPAEPAGPPEAGIPAPAAARAC